MAQCNKAISLLMDRSSSINNEDWVHQVEATANAIEDPEVMALILSNGGVAFNAFSFSNHAMPILEWHVLDSEANIHAFVAKLRDYVSDTNASNQVTQGSTETNAGIDKATESLTTGMPAACRHAKPIIDLSTDGEPNDIDRASMASRRAAALGITINGIAIEGVGVTRQSAYEALDQHIVTKHTGGRAFQANWSNFKEIIKEKLKMELLAETGIGKRFLAPQHQTEPDAPASTPNQPQQPMLRRAG